MQVNTNIKKLYEIIQKQLFHMIPEKWDRVYLYASVWEDKHHLQTGEMFFYYYPKSLLKKLPVNVYEVPNKFNLDEHAYLYLAEKLYEEIKKLRDTQIELGERPWSNLTILIEDFKFTIVYHYDDLLDSKYTSYDRHLIWKHKYLGTSLNSYLKKDRKRVEEFLKEEEYRNPKINTYTEGIYKKPVSNITEYRKAVVQEEQEIKNENKNVEKVQIIEEKTEEFIEKEAKEEIPQPVYRNQILAIQIKEETSLTSS